MTTLLCCVGHSGPHNLGLRLHLGTTSMTVGDVARLALPHAFVGDEDNPQAAIAEAVLDRARTGEPEVSDEEADALIKAMLSAQEYMQANRYDADADFPDDVIAARALNTSIYVNVCWRDR